MANRSSVVTPVTKAQRDAKDEANRILREADGELRNGDFAREKRQATDDYVTPAQVKAKKGKPKESSFNLKGVAEVLIEHGLNPANEILRVMPELEPDVQAKLYAELLQYIQPKLRSIEHSGKNGGPIEMTMLSPEKRKARIAELLAK